MKLFHAIGGLMALAGVVIVIAFSASAVAQEVTYGGGSVQAYASESPLSVGTIVNLSTNGEQTVEATAQKNLVNTFGVTVDRNQLLTVTSTGSLQNEVYVAVSGTYNVLVNDQAGVILPGDYITVSSVDGMGMKAGTDEETVLGRAITGFNGSASLGSTTLRDTQGAVMKDVKFGSIPVAINVQHNPNIVSTEANLPSFLQRVGEQIAEKEVSPVRVYLSLGIAVVSVVSAVAVLYAGVRNSIISIGRNPMSKRSIGKALAAVILTSLLILIIGLFAVYLLLKL